MKPTLPLQPPKRLPVVGVMGSGTEPCEAQASRLGAWLADHDVHLLTGGGGGVMEAVSRAFYARPGRKGIVIGIIPGQAAHGTCHSLPGYPNPWVELPVFTHLPLRGGQGAEPLSRNHINILTSSVIVALPGRFGTASEVRLALQYKKPLIAYVCHRGQIPDLPPQVPAADDFKKITGFILAHI